MSKKNSMLAKRVRREYKKIKKQTHNKESKWIKIFNKYGLLEYIKLMLPRAERKL